MITMYHLSQVGVFFIKKLKVVKLDEENWADLAIQVEVTKIIWDHLNV